MSKADLLGVTIFLVLVLGLVAARLWGTRMWPELDAGMVVFTAVVVWLCVASLTFEDEGSRRSRAKSVGPKTTLGR